jgi:glutamate--cysteine ligase
VPGILEDLHTQNLLPPLHAGWHTRRNHRHLQCYDELCKRFGKLIGVEPWLFNPLFELHQGMDMREPQHVEQLRATVDNVLGKVKKRYKEYGIQDKPFVVLKGDNGSMGLGAMTVRDPKQLDALLAARACSKHGAHDIIVQEGVLTHERVNNAVAEPVVYLMDRYVVGGFYRVHPERGADEDLCAPGANYVPLAFEDGIELPQPGVRPGASAPNRFYMYGVIARLSMLAASYELEATDPLAEH